MKKNIFIALMMMVSSISFSQPTINPARAVQADYLQKSKNQKTAAWILLGTGTVLITTGFVVGVNEGEAAIISLFTGEPESSSNTGEILFWTGLGAAAGSIPLFIASGKNRRKAIAASASIDIKRNYRTEAFTVKSSAYPALTLKLSL